MKVKAFLKKPNDPIGAIRISCGSFEDEAYIVYRGGLKQVKETIEAVYQFLIKQEQEAINDPREDYENHSN